MTTKNEKLQNYYTFGTFVDQGWKHKEDFLLLSCVVKTVEQALGIKEKYNIFLYPDPPDIKTGVKPIRYGAFVTFPHKIAPPCVLVVENFEELGHYAVKDKSDNVVYSLDVDKEDLLIANLAEEIFHLNDYRLGKIPKGVSTGEDSDKYHVNKGIPFEVKASLFRIEILASLRPKKWASFLKLLSILNKSHQQFSIIWES